MRTLLLITASQNWKLSLFPQSDGLRLAQKCIVSSQCFPREYPKATVPGEFEHDRFFSFVIARGPGSNLLREPANLSVTVTEPDEFLPVFFRSEGKEKKTHISF